MLSRCHNAPVSAITDGEGGTSYYRCGTCHQPCDFYSPEPRKPGLPRTAEEQEKLLKMVKGTEPPTQAQSLPMGVSQWKNHGVKYGYWTYFRTSVLQEVLQAIYDMDNAYPEAGRKVSRGEIVKYLQHELGTGEGRHG